MELQQARKVLKDAGYQTDNLWQINDVKGNYNCTDEEAMEMLIETLTNETTMEQIWLAIDICAQNRRIENKND
jgi:cobalamin-dependent methionine synthase I